MILHLINKPYEHPIFARALSLIAEGDAILLMEDGVYAGTHRCAQQTPAFGIIVTPIFALKDDIMARGIDALLSPNIQTMTDAEFVELTCKYDKTVSWY
jgi:tRNA 2-thiouridine synthesizing protein B